MFRGKSTMTVIMKQNTIDSAQKIGWKNNFSTTSPNQTPD